MKLEINGRVIEVDDSFADLPLEQKQAAIDEIADRLSSQGKQKPTAKEKMVDPITSAVAGTALSFLAAKPIATFTEGFQNPKPPAPQPGPETPRAEAAPAAKEAAVPKWTKTQLDGDYYGGRDYASAYQRGQDVRKTLAETPGYGAAQGSGLMAPRGALEEFEARKAAKEALEKRNQMSFGEKFAERYPRTSSAGSRLGAGASNVIMKGVRPTVGKAAVGTIGGVQAADAYNRYIQGDIPGAALSGIGAVGTGAMLVPNPKVRAIGALTSLLGSGANMLRNPEIEPTKPEVPEHIKRIFNKAEGGVVGYAGGKQVVQGGLDVAKKLFAPKPTKTLKASEALGQHENKRLGLTQTDNFGVHGGRMGGNQFPNFQNISPKHAKDRVVWMNDTENHANAMVRNSKFGNEDVIWSTYIGAPDQLKSNKTVWNDILANHYDRNLTPEQVEIINKRIATLKRGKDKGLLFSQPFDIRDKFAVQELVDTFDRRSAMASMLGEGKGVGGKKMGIALPQYQDILRSHRDPLTEGVPTSSVGTRLFSVDPTPSRFSKEYHPDYEWTVHGQDMGVQFNPVPQKLIVPDWYARTEAKAPGKNLTHGNAWFSYMKDPQRITHEYLMNLEKAGYKTGGLVGIDKE